MYLGFIITLVLDVAVLSQGYSKCCETTERLEIVNDSYKCIENLNKRLDILTNDTNFLARGVDGECVDITDNFSIFNVSGRKIVEERVFRAPYFSKCCPLNYTYNSLRHSCEEKENVTHYFIKETFVKVGLPNCKIIVDEDIDLYQSVIDRHSEYCIDENERGTFTVRVCKNGTELCKQMRCVKKCCPDGDSFVGGAKCRESYTRGLNLKSLSFVDDPEEPFAVITNSTCKSKYLMNEERYIFSLTKEGIFRYWRNYTNSFVYEDVYHPNSYCLEYAKTEKLDGLYFFKCRVKQPVKKKFTYTLIPKIISCVFLGTTILIYLFLNETRTLFGKILMNYCLSTLFLFSILTYIHTNLETTDLVCKFLGYALIFFSTASFSWLNVMCCDIWWTFGSMKQTSQVRKLLKKLLCYLIYGWGLPTLLTLVIFIFSEKYVFIPYIVQPFVGTYVCFIEHRPNNYGAILFLRFPHFVIQLVNTILFFRTILYCLKIKNEINRINDTIRNENKSNYNRDKERLWLIVKLAIIMGITFVFDVVSAFVDMSEMGIVPRYIEIVWDCINCSQGVFIFIIFICKKRIFYEFLRRMKLKRRNTVINRSMTLITRDRKSTKPL